MRKEIIGIILFALVIFTLGSLFSYHPDDPSIHSAAGGNVTHNMFGVMGAHTAGLLIGLFGIGAFWIPVLFLYFRFQFFLNNPGLSS